MNLQSKAIIADDEPLLLAHLCKQLNTLWPELEIVGKAEDGLQAKKLLMQLKPDIAFLDIRMPGLSGLTVARAAPDNCRIVFVTAYDEYAIEAFEETAVDYLLKPVTEKRLLKSIDRLKHQLCHIDVPHRPLVLDRLQFDPPGKKSLQWIKAKQGRKIKIIPVDSIYFFQAEDKYTKVVTDENEYLIRTPIKDLREELDSDRFWCIHRSTIVNCSEIDTVSKSMSGRFVVSLKNHPQKLTASRRFGHLFKQM